MAVAINVQKYSKPIEKRKEKRKAENAQHHVRGVQLYISTEKTSFVQVCLFI